MANKVVMGLVIGAVVLLVTLLFMSFQSKNQETFMNKEPAIKQGSKVKALMSRSELRRYAIKIESGEITEDEVREYIIKGGSIDQYKYYDYSRSFFVGTPQYSLLNRFIQSRYYTDQQNKPEDRLQILSLFLSAGANPNFNVESAGISKSGNLAPILQACSGDDIEAVKLLYKYGGNIELKEKTYLGFAGPCLAEAQTIELLDWLLAEGADLLYEDEYGRTLLDLSVTQSGDNEKIRWLMSQGISSKIGSSGIGDLIEIVNESLSKNRKKLSNLKVDTLNPSQFQENLESEIKVEEEKITKKEELLLILSGK